METTCHDVMDYVDIITALTLKKTVLNGYKEPIIFSDCLLEADILQHWD